MKDFKEFLAEKMTEINLLDDLDKPERIKLSEAEDDDPFADDAGDTDTDTDTTDDSDPFGDDMGGGDGPGGGSSGGSDADEEDGEETDGENSTEADKKADELDLEGHEDDPDFLKGATDGDDVTLSDKPSGECIYDVDGIMKAIAAVIQGTNETDLEEIVAVKKAVELIFNGKILKPEDVQFTNTQNAAFLIKKIGEKVDEKTKNYLMVKIKEPLIKQRDQQKLDIVALKKDVNAARDTIQDLDQA